MIQLFKDWWNKSTGFRHFVTAWLGVQLALPLGQVLVWAQSKGAQPLPDWGMVLSDLGFATLTAVIAGLLKWLQQKRAFPTITTPSTDWPTVPSDDSPEDVQ